IPALMTNKQESESHKPNYHATNINAWIATLFSKKPKSYQYLDEYLKPLFVGLQEISIEQQELRFIFQLDREQKTLKFSQLSYGERIFVLWAAILASVKLDLISLCVWDEPENYISLIEIQHYFMELHQAFHQKAQFIATTHNPETMRMFSSDDIFILKREHHLQPIRLYPVQEMNVQHDIVEAIKAGLVEL
ncbi:MAG: AAA family ATPase, partial [Acinetobacter sp.]|nr:AAA family ATPase [Acinetobacter sp.]